MDDVKSLIHTKWNCKYHISVCIELSQESIL